MKPYFLTVLFLKCLDKWVQFNFFLCQGFRKSLFFTVKYYGYIIKVLTDLLMRITIIEQKNLQKQKTDSDMVKEIKKMIEEKVRCAY